MAVGSVKKKKSKRRSPNPSPPMAGSPCRNCCRRSAALPSALVAFSVLLLLYLTWKKAASHVNPLHSPPPPQFYSFDIVNEFPHDPEAFTQGLLYGGNDTLYESTGLYHRSSVRQVHLQNGKVILNYQMDGSLFGEGLTLLGERLFQVTWLNQIGFIYDRFNFSKREKFTHQMRDGWGLATDGKVIFGSDGTSTLYQLDPITLNGLFNLEHQLSVISPIMSLLLIPLLFAAVIRKAIVRYDDRDVPYLNELEYINSEIWANIWMTDCIARISYNDGNVLGWIFLHELRQGLLKSGYMDIDVLNGIAWDEEKNRLFVTGKLWPKLYEIKLRRIRGPLNGNINELCPIRAY